jgi:hypothetical protein
MKKAVKNLVCLGILPLLFTPGWGEPASPPPEVPLLLAKFNFENLPAWIPDWGAGHGSQYRPATGWRGPFRVSLDMDNPHSGDAALRVDLLEATEKEQIIHSPAIPVTESPGLRQVRVILFVRSDGRLGETGASIRVLERDRDGRSIGLLSGRERLGHVPDSPEWVEIKVQGTLNSRTRSITFMLVATRPDTPSTLWADDISIELLHPSNPNHP